MHTGWGAQGSPHNWAGSKAGDLFLSYCWLFWEIPVWKLWLLFCFSLFWLSHALGCRCPDSNCWFPQVSLLVLHKHPPLPGGGSLQECWGGEPSPWLLAFPQASSCSTGASGFPSFSVFNQGPTSWWVSIVYSEHLFFSVWSLFPLTMSPLVLKLQADPGGHWISFKL